jgi:uncharacterized protein YbbK (DUF523 family)
MGELLIGVSACLPGERVRYDGGHERNAVLLEELGPTSGSFRSGRRSAPDSDFRASPSDCAAGRSHPSPGSAGADHTDAMPRWVGKDISELRDRDLSGFVHKKGSPSCGLERIRVSD